MRGGPAIAGGLRALRRVVHVALWSGVGVGGLSVAFAAVVLAPYHLRPRWVLEALPILGTWHDVDPASAVGLLLLLVVVPFVSARAFDELAGRGGHELRIRRDLAETPTRGRVTPLGWVAIASAAGLGVSVCAAGFALGAAR